MPVSGKICHVFLFLIANFIFYNTGVGIGIIIHI